MLCTEEHKPDSTNWHAKSNLFRSYTLYYKLWYKFLGYLFSHANKVFILQKKIIRIITNTRPRDSCREAFKSMEILTLYSQYIYSLVLYTIKNKHLFDSNNEIHKYNLHRPIANLSKFNNGAYISGIKVFNHLPQYIEALTNNHKHFKSTLKRFLFHHSFY